MQSVTFDEISRLTPSQMLDKAEATPPRDTHERIVLPIIQEVGYALGSLIAVFTRPINAVCGLKSLCQTGLETAQRFSKKNVVHVTKEMIASSSNFSSELQLKLLSVLYKIENLQKKMGLNGNIDCLLVEDGHAQLCGAPSSFRSFSVVISPSFLKKHSHEEMEFILAHELSHLKHYDSFRIPCFDMCVCLVQIAFIACLPLMISLPSIVLVSALAGRISIVWGKAVERRSDYEAMTTLNSTQSAVNYFSNKLKRHYMLKHASFDEVRKLDPSISFDEYIAGNINFNSKGDALGNHTHDATTERLAQALSFKPQRVALGAAV